MARISTVGHLKWSSLCTDAAILQRRACNYEHSTDHSLISPSQRSTEHLDRDLSLQTHSTAQCKDGSGLK